MNEMKGKVVGTFFLTWRLLVLTAVLLLCFCFINFVHNNVI